MSSSRKLHELQLSYNQLTTLPSLGLMENLDTLDISENKYLVIAFACVALITNLLLCSYYFIVTISYSFVSSYMIVYAQLTLPQAERATTLSRRAQKAEEVSVREEFLEKGHDRSEERGL